MPNQLTVELNAANVKEFVSQIEDQYAAARTPYPFNSGYFMCVRLNDLDAEAFRIRLLQEYGIGVIAAGGSDITPQQLKEIVDACNELRGP